MAKPKFNLGGLFFKVEDDDKGQPAIAPVIAAPAPTATVGFSPSVGQEDVEIKKQLISALEQANLEGYDYFEFAKAVEAQAALIASEQLRFQSAYAAASVIGVTVDKLTASAQHYLSILAAKESEFDKFVEQHTSANVTAKEEEMKSLDGQMQAKAAEIQKMTEDINAMQQRKTAMSNEIASARAEIEKVKNNFSATLTVFTSKIKSDIDKIKSYLERK